MNEGNLLVDRLAACYSGAVYDVLRAMGLRDQVLPHEIRGLRREVRTAGPAFTMQGALQADLSEHETLLRWTEFLSAAPSGSVVICQPNDDTLAHMGELSAETLQVRGIRGYVVDGGCRDSDFILGRGFPVFCRYLTPKDIVGRWAPTELGAPVGIGGVTIRTGDLVLADADGVVATPAEHGEKIVEAAEVLMRTESALRRALVAGEDPREAYLSYGVF